MKLKIFIETIYDAAQEESRKKLIIMFSEIFHLLMEFLTTHLTQKDHFFIKAFGFYQTMHPEGKVDQQF